MEISIYLKLQQANKRIKSEVKMKITNLFIIIALIFVTIIGCDQGTKKVTFISEGKKLAGNLYYPSNFEANKKYAAIIVVGSWTTVKEQMAEIYAKKLANKGYVALAFDFRNYGESEGDIRFYESPKMKIKDIKNAVTYLQTLKIIDKNKIGAFAVCAGAGYVLKAASGDKRIKAITTAAAWLHDNEAVKMFYGGEKGVKSKIKAAKIAKANYKKTGKIDYIPTISTTDKSAAMFGPYDYYLNPKRGAIRQWSADKFAVMSWEDWLKFNPMPSAAKLTTPTLMIHSDGAVLPVYTKKYFKQIKTKNKKLHWIKSGKQSPFEQFDFYDNTKKVNLSIELADNWFQKYLTK